MTPVINPNVYPTKYHVAGNFGGEVSEIEFSDSLKDLNLSGKLPFDQEMDETNCYCGFDPTKKNNYVGAVNYGYIQFDPNNVRNVNIVSRQYTTRINYRLVIKANSSYGMEPLTNRKIRYTNNVEPITTLENTTYTLACAPSQTFTFTPNEIYSQVFRQYPITKIDYDKLVIFPWFQTYELSFTYDSDGDIVGITEDARPSYQYNDIKPEDKTPAGQHYDQDLWERGYKDTFEIVDGVRRLTKRTIVTNVDCVPFYGKSSRTTVGYADFSQGWDADGNKVIPQDGLYTWYGIAPMVEIVDEITGSIFYEDIPGLVFPRHDAYGWTNYSESFGFRAGFQQLYFSYPMNTMMNYPANASVEAVLLNNDENDLENSYTFITSHSANFSQDFTDQAKTRVYYLGDNGGIFTYVNNAAYDSYGFGVLIPRAFPIKDLMSSIASLGLFIAGDQVTAMTTDITTSFPNTMYHGNIDENGITDGTWVQGDDIEDLPKHKDIEYDPIKPGPPGPEPGDDSKDKGDIGYNTNVPAGISAFTTSYILSAGALSQLGRDLWSKVNDPNSQTHMIENFFHIKPPTMVSPTPAELPEGTVIPGYELSTANIIDYFISLKYFPFNLAAYTTNHVSSPPNTIKVGSGTEAISTGGFNSLITGTNLVVLDGGSVDVPIQYNSFLDHEPYASVSVYVPYCGSVNLQPSLVRGSTLSLRYCVDLNTGGCMAIIMKSGNGASFPVATINGTMGFDILLTGNNAQTVQANANNVYANAVTQSTMNTAASIYQAGIHATSGNLAGVATDAIGATMSGIGTALNYVNDLPQLLGTSPLTAGSSSMMAALMSPQTAYVQIRYRIPKTDGYEWLGGVIDEVMSIGMTNGMGYVKIVNPRLNGLSCTRAEKEEIRALLAAGIFT